MATPSSIYGYRQWESPLLSFIVPARDISLQEEHHRGYSLELINSAMILFDHTVELQGLHENDENIFKKPTAVSNEYRYQLFAQVYDVGKNTIKTWHTYGQEESQKKAAQPVIETSLANFNEVPKTAQIRFLKSTLTTAVSHKFICLRSFSTHTTRLTINHPSLSTQINYLYGIGTILTLPVTKRIMRNGYLKMKNKTYKEDEECYKSLVAQIPTQIEEDFAAGKMGITCCDSFVWNYLRSLNYSRKKVLTKATYNMNACLAYIYMLLHFIIVWQLQPYQLLNLDETGVFFAMAIMYAYAKGGENQEAAADADEKKRLTVVHTISMNGVRYQATCIHKSLARNRYFSQNTYSEDADALNFTKEFLPEVEAVCQIGKEEKLAKQKVSGVKKKSQVEGKKRKKNNQGTRFRGGKSQDCGDDSYEEEDDESEKSEAEVFEGDNNEDDTTEGNLQFDDASHDRIYHGRDIFGNIKVKEGKLDIQKLLSPVVNFDDFCTAYNQELRAAQQNVGRSQGKRTVTGTYKQKHSEVKIGSEEYKIFLRTLEQA